MLATVCYSFTIQTLLSISNATNTGNITASASYAGGIAGWMTGGTLSDISVAGTISGLDYIGGLVGVINNVSGSIFVIFKFVVFG
jgi:hypothetical protein